MRERIRGDIAGGLSNHLYGGYAMPGYPFHGYTLEDLHYF